ncbi:hypothetical protein [Algoriphagus litoralis]|uniref:hypothetical protein n=1 Tax=Algoriphagus litoralis TaxID=2202829 RepID=UPI000DB964EC|nr:hypothetical protein [Algoriphagus litoralis]
MKKVLLLFLIISSLISSCSEEDLDPVQACNTNNALVELPWLAELIEAQEQSEIGKKYSYISKGIYQGETIFSLQNCCPFCNSIYLVINCEGETLGYLGSGGIEPSSITDWEVIWKSSENTCVTED